MAFLRRFFRDHRRLALLLVALTLAIRALVPAGYMVGGQTTTLTIAVCADASGAEQIRQIVVPHDGKDSTPGQGDHAKDGGVCSWSSLAMGALTGTDSILLGLALAFILALGFTPTRVRAPAPIAYLRPPLRGPPTFA
jgi:hypothetical protein